MFKKFWLGQTPMWFNVWILGVVFFRLLIIGMIFGLDALGLFNDAGGFAIMAYISLPIYIIWGVATWRSAQIYKGRKLWSSLTELFVILKCGGAILSIFLGSSFLI